MMEENLSRHRQDLSGGVLDRRRLVLSRRSPSLSSSSSSISPSSFSFLCFSRFRRISSISSNVNDFVSILASGGCTSGIGMNFFRRIFVLEHSRVEQNKKRFRTIFVTLRLLKCATRACVRAETNQNFGNRGVGDYKENYTL